MKNIHILPTEKPSPLMIEDGKLFYSKNFGFNEFNETKNFKHINKQNIYITSDEEIKEGDWFIANNGVHKCIRVDENTSCPFITLNSKGEEIGHFKTWRTKIILTTNQDLIGVQAIDDEFLEWFVNNPSCEFVETLFHHPTICDEGDYSLNLGYWTIIIPKEEVTLANMKCTCMRFEANCFSGRCKNCGFPPKEEPKQVYEYQSECICGTECKEFTNVKCKKPKQETIEEVRVVKRTELYNSILSIVKQIPRKEVEGDAMDAPSCAYELQQLFLKWQQEQDNELIQDLKDRLGTVRHIVEKLKEQDKNKYSEEEVLKLLSKRGFDLKHKKDSKTTSEWFEQFKKK